MPLTSLVMEQMMARFVTFIDYKKVKTKFKKVQCILNRCKVYFSEKNFVGLGVLWWWQLLQAESFKKLMYIVKKLDSLKGNDWLKNSNVMAMIILRHTWRRKGVHIKAETWLE